MGLKLAWYKNKQYKDCILGICKELPDNFCHFSIIQQRHQRFKVIIPSLGSENISKSFIFRDANIARQFCEDFLNFNLKAIVQHQIHEMKRRTIKAEKSVGYYEKFASEWTPPLQVKK